jgi:hypothetical protein
MNHTDQPAEHSTAEDGASPEKQGSVASKMAANNHQLLLNKTAGKKNSRSSKRAANGAADSMNGKEQHKQSNEQAERGLPGGAGPESTLLRSVVAPAAPNISEKKYLLKKNQFESDLALSTGRFEDGASVDGVQKENFSKSANQAKVLRIINAEDLVGSRNPHEPYGLSAQIEKMTAEPRASHGIAAEGGAGPATLAVPGGFNDDQQATSQEQEMRETSYFKQQTDDEGAQATSSSPPKRPLQEANPQFQSSDSIQQPTQQRVASLNELIRVSNQQNLQAPNATK